MEVTREVFQKLKSQPFFKGVVVSDSMSPVIKVGDKIVVEVNSQGLNRFDIIVFWKDGIFVCHYLWAMNRVVKPVLLQTRSLPGGKDIPITFDDYFGKVMSHKLSTWDKMKIYYRIRKRGSRRK